MKVDQLQKIIHWRTASRRELLTRRGFEYSGDEDTLADAKQCADICCILDIDVAAEAWDNFMYMVVLKLVRLCRTWTEDGVQDLQNYLDLADACKKEMCSQCGEEIVDSCCRCGVRGATGPICDPGLPGDLGE